MLDDLEALTAEVALSDARALLITGAGERAFCAGADLDESAGQTLEEHRSSIRRGQQRLDAVAALPIPTVALINGLALGGGLEVALACDFRLCRTDARLGFPEVKVGLLPGYGGTQRLPRLVGPALALEIVLTGDPVDADRARAIGLVNEVIDGDLLVAGLAFARRMTRHSLVAVRLARSAVRSAATNGLEAGLQLEADLSTEAYESDDAREGVAAFFAKREPQFNDR
jgi:enoyl-CoA hydratase